MSFPQSWHQDKMRKHHMKAEDHKTKHIGSKLIHSINKISGDRRQFHRFYGFIWGRWPKKMSAQTTALESA